jgi:hypothetical protein
VKLSTEVVMTGVEAPLIIVAWELTREGKEKGKERRGRGHSLRGQLGRGRPCRGGYKGRRCPLELSVLVPVRWLCCLRKKGRGRRREEKKREEKKKRKKYGNFSKLENIQKK